MANSLISQANSRLSVAVGIGAVVTIVVTLANVVLTYRNTRQLQEDAAWVAHTHEVRTCLQNLLSLAVDAETGQRGYVITGEQRYLEPYHTATAALDQQLARGRELTADNPRQQSRFPELQRRIVQRQETLKDVIELRQTKDFEAARQSIATGRGKAEMDAIRELIGDMLVEEQRLLDERAAKSLRSYRVSLVGGLVSGISAIASVLAFLAVLRRHLVSREKAAFVIAEQGERFRTTLASIGDAVITTDTEGRVTNLNAVAEELTGWPLHEAQGQSLTLIFKIVNESTRLPVENPALRALRTGTIIGLANHTILIAKGGHERPIDDSAAPIRCADGEIVGCVLVFRDITERKHAEDELRKMAADLSEADRRKDEFLSILAHELRNPLAPLRNGLQIIELTGGQNDTVRETRTMMERQLKQLVRLVDDLLDVSRISRGKLELRKERVELGPILSHAVETSRPVIDAARHELTVQLPAHPVYVDADVVRLAQVFANMLNNAAKYTHPGGKIRLTAERQGTQAVVSVKDNGVGIPPAMLAKIFDMFVQVDRTLEKTQGGLGIGLTLARRLIEMHGGTIEVRSDGQDRGSEFTVRLPVVLPEAPSSVGRDDAASPARRSRPRRILVADDNEDSARTLAMMLRMSGHEVETAKDGMDALDVTTRFIPEVAFLDIGMPKLNGYELGRRIREQTWGQNVLMVALTGWGQEDDKQRSQEAGFDYHFVKPVDPAALDRLLAEAEGG